MTTEEHNKYLAYSFFAYGAIHTLFMVGMALFFIFMFSSIPQGRGRNELPIAVPFFFLGFIALIQLIFIVPAFIAGLGLLKKKKWARIAAIIGGVLAGANFPIGSAVCVYALWFLLSERGKSLYEDQNLTSHNYFPPQRWQGQPPPSLWADRAGDEADVNDRRK
ncbi:MAG TPA: hypothetical protein VKA70_19745 [Blastocatellia bacterium]|nr:hypothetical protein [Blastocatellia bacterium]